MSLKAKVILIFAAVFLLGGGVIAYFAYQAAVSKGLDIQISGPDKTPIGVPFDVKVNFTNKSENIFREVRLNVSLPDGMAFLGAPAAKNVDFRDLGELRPGETSQQQFRLIALDGQNTFKRFTVSGNYLSGSLSSRFQQETDFQLAVGDYAIGLDIATPQKIFSGESFGTEIAFRNNSAVDFDNLKLTLEYPPAFTFSQATLKPDIGNNVWLLGGLRKGSENKFTVTGNLVGPDDASFELKATLIATFLGEEYPINVNTASLLIAASPLSIKISVNDSVDYIANPGEFLKYELSYVNTTDVGLRDVIVKAQLIGEMFDFSQLTSGGSFNSANNTLTWNASHVPNLGTLAPGESGSISFAVKTKSAYPIRRLSDKNFLLKVRASIESPTVPPFVEANKTFSLTSLDTKVAGKIELKSKVYFRDAASGVINEGPFPPRVNQPTEYTVHWQIVNFPNDAKEVSVRAFLGSNARFTGFVKTSAGIPAPVYNERTQEMTWNIGRVPATVGVASPPIEAIFQIAGTPSSADIGRFMVLIQESSLKAADEFTGQELSSTAPSVTTELPDDPTVTGSQGIVKQ